jgi:4-hydroxybenzoate polyprenyltransferase
LALAWQEARPVVQLIFMLRFAAGAALGGPATDAVAVSVVIAAAGWLAATWAVYLLNGVADVVEDRENCSTRPIARGELPAGSATTVVWLLAVFGLVAAAIVSVTMVVLVALMLAVGWAYSMGPSPLKRNVAGFVFAVTVLGLLTYLAGWCACGGGKPNESLLLFGVAMSLWMALGGSTKDLPDTRGDWLAGRRTLPVLLGERRARLAMAVAASLLGWMFVILGAVWVDHLLPVALVVCAGSAALALVALTSISGGDRCAKRRPYHAFMVTQYLAHVSLFICLELALTG